MASPKMNTSPFAPLSTNCNILQPKRLNSNVDPVSLGRRILGQKGQLPSPNNGISHLSNQQLTTLLRNSPLIDNCGSLTNSSGDLGSLGECGTSVTKRAPTTMAKRNARERNRVKQVNQGFQTLRQHIPESYRMKKMSKVDTLRCALVYIRNLERTLQDTDEEPMSLGMNMVSSSSTVSVSPSTTLSFSSEDDEIIVQAFSSLEDPDQDLSHAQSPSSNACVDKMGALAKEIKQESDDQFKIFESSLGPMSYEYNNEDKDENNLENLHNVQICPCDQKLSSTAGNNFGIGVIPVSLCSEGESRKSNPGRDTGSDHGDGQMSIVTTTTKGGQSQGHLNVSDGHSDTENSFCEQEDLQYS